MLLFLRKVGGEYNARIIDRKTEEIAERIVAARETLLRTQGERQL